MTKLEKIIQLYNQSGRIAFHYKRLQKIALNGGRMVSYSDALNQMTETLQNDIKHLTNKAIC